MTRPARKTSSESVSFAILMVARLVVLAVGLCFLTGCGSALGKESAPDTAPDTGSQAASTEPPMSAAKPPLDSEAEAGGVRPLPTPVELAEALFSAELYSSAAWLYRGIAQDGSVNDSQLEEALLLEATSLLLASPTKQTRRIAVAQLERLARDFPASRHRPAALALIEESKRISRLEQRLAEVRQQLEALRSIDLETPPRNR